uniref:Uncharacterized protein n=1 Tax=Anguilla anguilla TaxID=7936 RepID=A0A0E9RGT7_ANGAN
MQGLAARRTSSPGAF